MKNPALKYGLISGIGIILLSALGYLIGAEFMLNFGRMFMIFYLLMYVYFSFKIRSDLGGYISYGSAFGKIFLMCLISSLLNILFTLLLYNVIDPGFHEKIQALVLAKAQAEMELKNVPQENMEMGLKMAKKFSGNLGLVIGFFGYALLSVVFSLIMAAILKKEKPLIGETAPEGGH